MRQPLNDGIKQVFPNGETGDLGRRLLGCDGAGSSQQRLDAHDEFLHPERLFQVIVGPHLKAVHHIIDCRARRQEDDGSERVALADAFCHVKSVQARHHHVGNDDVGP